MRTVVIGNAVVDDFLAIETWPRPGMSVIADSGGRDLGGKGANQAIVLARCGTEVELLTCVGRDEPGDWIVSALAAEGVSTRRCKRSDGVATDRSTVLVGPAGENAIITTVACMDELTIGDIDDALDAAASGDKLLLQGNLPLEKTRAALIAARARKMITAFNPSPVREGFAALLPLVDQLLVNAHEAQALSRRNDPAEAAAELRAQGAGAVVVTLGANGVLANTAAGVLRVPARRAGAVDTTGAGDTFAAVLIALWQRPGAIDDADLATAAAAAAITIGRQGTRSAFPSRDELRWLFDAKAA